LGEVSERGDMGGEKRGKPSEPEESKKARGKSRKGEGLPCQWDFRSFLLARPPKKGVHEGRIRGTSPEGFEEMADRKSFYQGGRMERGESAGGSEKANFKVRVGTA